MEETSEGSEKNPEGSEKNTEGSDKNPEGSDKNPEGSDVIPEGSDQNEEGSDQNQEGSPEKGTADNVTDKNPKDGGTQGPKDDTRTMPFKAVDIFPLKDLDLKCDKETEAFVALKVFPNGYQITQNNLNNFALCSLHQFLSFQEILIRSK